MKHLYRYCQPSICLPRFQYARQRKIAKRKQLYDKFGMLMRGGGGTGGVR